MRSHEPTARHTRAIRWCGARTWIPPLNLRKVSETLRRLGAGRLRTPARLPSHAVVDKWAEAEPPGPRFLDLCRLAGHPQAVHSSALSLLLATSTVKASRPVRLGDLRSGPLGVG